jgi:hypothetical protein
MRLQVLLKAMLKALLNAMHAYFEKIRRKEAHAAMTVVVV